MTFALVFLGMAILIAMVIVRIGAVALEMTGLDVGTARFQALSAFTGTGFTTREAEDVVRHPQRRRVVAVLIVLGYAGVVTLSAGLLQTLLVRPEARWGILLDLAGLVLAAYLLYKFFLWPRLAARIDRQIRAGLATSFHLETARVEEILTSAEGWAIARFQVPDDCPYAHHTLGASRPRDQGILILAVERGREIIHSPGRDTVVLPGDILLAYGRIEQLDLLSRTCAVAPPPEPEA